MFFYWLILHNMFMYCIDPLPFHVYDLVQDIFFGVVAADQSCVHLDSCLNRSAIWVPEHCLKKRDISWLLGWWLTIIYSTGGYLSCIPNSYTSLRNNWSHHMLPLTGLNAGGVRNNYGLGVIIGPCTLENPTPP